MNSLFGRGHGLPTVARAQGCWVTDTEGRDYLDGCSGAVVVNVGHGDSRVAAAIRRQLDSVAYVHGAAFESRVVADYATRLSQHLPMEDPLIYPVSGGSEAVETALKAARAFHLANGEPERVVVIGRDLSYHGNTRGALDVSGRWDLRGPYEPWLGLSGRVPAVLEYRCPSRGHPYRCGEWHAGALAAEIERIGSHRVAAFIAEPVGGAASGAAVPPDGYWEAISAVCAANGVLLIADEVMTGFGRTGRWFGSDHFGIAPDIMTMAKGAASGYWPLGLAAFSAKVGQKLLETGFVHGFTFSHHVVGAAAASAVLDRIEQLRLVEAAARQGPNLEATLRLAVGDHPHVGDIRGIGLLWAVELVEERGHKRPFQSERAMAHRVTRAARDNGLLVYPSRGSAGEGLGDLILVAPPLTISDSELETLGNRLHAAFAEVPG